MPIFEFECKDCSQSFEELVRSSSPLEGIACPECGSQHVRKKISTFASRITGGSLISLNSGSASSSCAPTGT
jgi:putative FmdB family regulatory protein